MSIKNSKSKDKIYYILNVPVKFVHLAELQQQHGRYLQVGVQADSQHVHDVHVALGQLLKYSRLE